MEQGQPNGIVIPANSTVLIEPGGYHIMLSGLRKTLRTRGTISLTLQFESGQTTMIVAAVSDIPPDEHTKQFANHYMVEPSSSLLNVKMNRPTI